MCINKTPILNKGYRDYNLYTPRYIDINCNHCWQCNLNRINDVTFRILSDITAYNCPSAFVTLSYSDFYLPYLVYRGPSGNSEKISCWNREHVKRYIKRIRRKLHYYFGVQSSSFKYFLTCERGSDEEYVSDSGKIRKATLRVHYHFIPYLLCDLDLSPCRSLPNAFLESDFATQFDSLLLAFWHYLLDTEWYYGNVDHQDMCRDIVSRVKYVCKYVCKNISDPVFKVSPKDVLGIIDPEFDISSDLWYIQLKHSSPGFDNSFKWGESYFTTGTSRKRYPRSIRFSSLFPRCMGSCNIGMSFLENLSYDEIYSYLSGVRKVCLPGVSSSTLIRLPSYYYRKVCKSTSFVTPGSHYVRDCVTPRSTYRLHLEHSSLFRLKFDWDNIQGLHIVKVPSNVSQTSLSDFGKLVQRHKFKNYVSNLIISLRYYFYNRSLFFDYLDKYSLFDKSFRYWLYDLYLFSFSPSDVMSSIDLSSLSFRKVAQAVRLSYPQYSDISVSEVKSLFSYIKLVEVCQYYVAHLTHLKMDKVYRDKFYSTCSDNPELFLPHYI